MFVVQITYVTGDIETNTGFETLYECLDFLNEFMQRSDETIDEQIETIEILHDDDDDY